MDTADSTNSPPPQPNRNRRWTRGLIAVLAILLAIEAIAYGRMMSTHWRLSSELHKAEREDYRITSDKVRQILGQRAPDVSRMLKVAVGEERYEIYYFQGLLKRHELCVHYGVPGLKSEPEVIEITTIMPDELLANP